MELRNRATGAIITDSQFRSENPNISFPKVLTTEILNDFGYDPVLEGPQATTTPPYQYSQRDGIEKINGQWFTKYIAGPVFKTYTDEQGVVHTAAKQYESYCAIKDAEQAKVVREERNKRLAATDWRVSYEVEKASVDGFGIQFPLDWATYRQALRDIPLQTGFPWKLNWPTPPNS